MDRRNIFGHSTSLSGLTSQSNPTLSPSSPPSPEVLQSAASRLNTVPKEDVHIHDWVYQCDYTFRYPDMSGTRIITRGVEFKKCSTCLKIYTNTLQIQDEDIYDWVEGETRVKALMAFEKLKFNPVDGTPFPPPPPPPPERMKMPSHIHF